VALGALFSAGAAAPTSGTSSNSRMSSIACGDSEASSPTRVCLVASGAAAGTAAGATLVFEAGFAAAGDAAFAATAGAGAAAGVLAAARADGDVRSGASSSTGATATGIGAGASAVGVFAVARRRTAIFCMIARTGGLTIRSSTPSLTDFRSARIMATPTSSPCGARTGRKIATRPSSRPFS
jgi:hypothetical protein